MGKKSASTTKSAKPKTSKSNASDPDQEPSDDESDGECHDSCLTEKVLKTHLTALEKSITESLGAAIEALQNELAETKSIASKALKMAEENKIVIEHLKSENINLKTRLHSIETEKLNAIEEQIENRTNRQLRKTLVFKGIPEMQASDRDPRPVNDADNNKKETWKETTDILAKSISDICENTSIQQAHAMLERCHRARENPNFQGKGPRTIFCAFYDWKDSEFVKHQFRLNNMNNSRSRTYAEQKYGPRTTVRRNQAMVLRKQLKEAGSITSGYVAHPARLMVKHTTNRNEHFICQRDFSKDEVKFGR